MASEREITAVVVGAVTWGLSAEELNDFEVIVEAKGSATPVSVLSEKCDEIFPGRSFTSAAVDVAPDALARLGGNAIEPGAGDAVPDMEHAPGAKQPALVIVTMVFNVNVDAIANMCGLLA